MCLCKNTVENEDKIVGFIWSDRFLLFSSCDCDEVFFLFESQIRIENTNARRDLKSDRHRAGRKESRDRPRNIHQQRGFWECLIWVSLLRRLCAYRQSEGKEMNPRPTNIDFSMMEDQRGARDARGKWGLYIRIWISFQSTPVLMVLMPAFRLKIKTSNDQNVAHQNAKNRSMIAKSPHILHLQHNLINLSCLLGESTTISDRERTCNIRSISQDFTSRIHQQ